MKRIVAVRARPRDSCVPASFLLVADACLSAQYTDKGVRIQSQIVESVIQENRVMVAIKICGNDCPYRGQHLSIVIIVIPSTIGAEGNLISTWYAACCSGGVM
ncbi:MAG: hypothetical protein MK103_16490 [Planctomycetes bacterium]|nr:hypothetical protein [Planctomycetota bacterium]